MGIDETPDEINQARSDEKFESTDWVEAPSYEGPDRRKDRALRRRIDALESRYRRLARTLLWGGCVLGATTVIGLAGQFVLDHRVQENREVVTRLNCNDVNERHDRAEKKLKELNFPPEADAATRVLIDTIVPKRDCEKAVERVKVR